MSGSLTIDDIVGTRTGVIDMPQRTDFDLIDAYGQSVMNYAASLYKNGEVVFSNVTFEGAWEDRDICRSDLEMRFNDLRQKIEDAERVNATRGAA